MQQQEQPVQEEQQQLQQRAQQQLMQCQYQQQNAIDCCSTEIADAPRNMCFPLLLPLLCLTHLHYTPAEC